MKTYYANRCSLGGTVGVREKDGTRSLRHVVRHSPDGFEWGYGGSGPSDLALSILVDYFEGTLARIENISGQFDALVRARSQKYYQQFKWDFIARAPEEGFEISADAIETWLEGQQ
jgi:hypothetical protein